MTSDELQELEREIEIEFQKELLIIVLDIKRTLAKYIQQNVYNSYSPVQYERTNSLISSIDSIVNFHDGVVFLDPSKLNYFSAVDSSRDVSPFVGDWLNNGHSDGGNGMYHDYPARHFLEDTVNEINLRYGGIVCEILNNK
ncbi:hypothetical protein [Clostridium sp. CF012]|uniref:hypothetical protein n=1 Tax=Clostridium sp. CF012 TaxID=2843319 RepID=UPI001C0D22A9|nr:hypothetical protein [Clostridium sp. CF012]MBU3142225.1 hypothetical protein [Clostridium sp. CF012]